MTFATSRLAIVEIARVLGDPVDAAAPDRLPPAAFAALRARLGEAGLDVGDPEAAEQALRHARDAYEPALAALGARLVLSLPPWARAPDAPDNWERDAPAAGDLYDAARAREVAHGVESAAQ
jgi:hypothetical protein